jgi:two-component system phosphate regulon response regulator PhoB
MFWILEFRNSMGEPSRLVLLIEPDDDSRSVYATALRDAGFTVIAVPDCAAGLYAIAEITPQIVVASVRPPTHDDCLALCERLRGDSRTEEIPILLTSETLHVDDLQRATDMKVLGVAAGPHDEAKIIGAVRGVLAVAAGRDAMPWLERNVKRSA